MSESESTKAKYTPNDWDEIRLSFSTSLMVDTNLLSLSQNLEITEWPIKGNSETPSKYIDYTYDELLELPGLAENAQRIDLLIDILKETMAFDNPFGDMVATVDAATKKDDNLGNNFIKIGVPKDFPISLTRLSDDTKAFCANEDVNNLGEFIAFSQNIAENIILGGDFKTLLNAFNHLDEKVISQFLPFRVRHTGLHLPEAIKLILTDLSENEKNALLKLYGKKLSSEQAEKITLNKDQTHQLQDLIKAKVNDNIKYFKEQFESLCKTLREGGSLERYFMVLENPETELIANKIVAQFLKQNGYLSDSQSNVSQTKKAGFFARLFGRG